jgi:hypothetical protein
MMAAVFMVVSSRVAVRSVEAKQAREDRKERREKKQYYVCWIYRK